MDLGLEVEVVLRLTKREMVLVSKALCGRLRPGPETEEALGLGRDMAAKFAHEMGERARAAEHASQKAAEE